MTKRLELPKFQAFDANGDPLSGGLVYTYAAGTTTEKTTYSDYDGQTANDNPVVLDSRGEAVIYLKGSYKIVLKTSADSTIWTMDNVVGGVGEDAMGDYYYPDYNAADHGVTGDSDTIKYAVDTIGSDPGVIYLRHNSGSANTTYTLTTSETIPSNITLISEPGAYITGAGTLTVNGSIDVGLWQIFDVDFNALFGRTGKIEMGLPQWFGAEADGSTDDQQAINSLADACRTNAIPIYFPPGDYYVTVSLNFSNANNDTSDTMGWTISGAGQESTQISGYLSSAYSIVDMTDNENSVLRDIRIYGESGGSQICGVLHGQVGTNLALRNKLESVLIDGTYSEAGYINVGADLSLLSHCYISGPIGALYSNVTDGISGSVLASAYNTLADGDATLNFIDNNCWIAGTGGDTEGWDAAIAMHECEKIVIHQSYIAQTSSATSGICVTGASGTSNDIHIIDFIGSRYENQTSGAGVFIEVRTENGLSNSILDGHVGGNAQPDTGKIFYLNGGGISYSTIKLQPNSAANWTNFVTRAGTETISYCEIFEQTNSGSLKDGIDSAILGAGNIVHLRRWDNAWTGAASGNIFYTGDKGRVTVGSSLDFSTIGGTTSLARSFLGLVESTWQDTDNTAAAGDETLDSYVVPGDLGLSNTAQHMNTLRIIAYGDTASNGNAKTIKGKFGVSGSETTLVSNDQTASPNNNDWEIDCEISRGNSTTIWVYRAKMIVGATVQSIVTGTVSADPDEDTVNFLVTADADAGDVTLIMFKVEIF